MASTLPTTETIPKLITVEELAATLQVSKRTVWRLVSAGKLMPPIRLGGLARWRQDEIRQWIESGCQSKKPKPR